MACLGGVLLAAVSVLYVLAPSRFVPAPSGTQLHEELSGHQLADVDRTLRHCLEQVKSRDVV
jgi:hypothetical protein